MKYVKQDGQEGQQNNQGVPTLQDDISYTISRIIKRLQQLQIEQGQALQELYKLELVLVTSTPVGITALESPLQANSKSAENQHDGDMIINCNSCPT